MVFSWARYPAFSFGLLLLLFFGGRLALAAETKEDLISISAVGDIMMGTDYPTNRLPPNDGMRFFEDSKEYLQTSDIRFGNFEGTLYDGRPGQGAKSAGPNRYVFRTPTRFVKSLQNAGFNVMSLANNHSRDMGKEGLVSTMETLRNAGILYAGKQEGRAELNIRGKKVAVIAGDYYPGGRSVTQPEYLLNEIATLSKKFDIVIVTYHVGREGRGAETVLFKDEIFLGENRGNSPQIAKDSIDAGADLVIMHGPHVPRGLEIYKDRLIAYSLGNFATGAGISINGNTGLAPLLRVQMKSDGSFHKGHIASFYQARPDRVVFDKEQRAFKMMRKLSESQFGATAPYFNDDGFFAPR